MTHMSQVCSLKPPKGGVIVSILLMNKMKSLIQSQMANKKQHRYSSPTAWLLQKSFLRTAPLALPPAPACPSPPPRPARRISRHSPLSAPRDIHADNHTGSACLLGATFPLCELLEFSTSVSYSTAQCVHNHLLHHLPFGTDSDGPRLPPSTLALASPTPCTLS